MFPLNRLWERRSSVTPPLSSVVTPCHSSSGASLSQFQLFVLLQLGPSVALYSATNTALSGSDGVVAVEVGASVDSVAASHVSVEAGDPLQAASSSAATAVVVMTM